MCTTQRIMCKHSVIKRCIEPVHRSVASGAGMGQAEGEMAWIGCAHKSWLMASITICGKRSVIGIHMALCAENGLMRTGEWEGSDGMVKRRWDPGNSGMAKCASCWEAGSHVIWICCAGELGEMA